MIIQPILTNINDHKLSTSFINSSIPYSVIA